MLTAGRLGAPRPFVSTTKSGARLDTMPSVCPTRGSIVVAATRKIADNKLAPAHLSNDLDFSAVGAADQPRVQRAVELRTRSAEPSAQEGGQQGRRDFRGGGDDRRGRRRNDDTPVQKHFLPLPKPSHLVYIKPTVAVVTDVASRSSVGVKMTAGNSGLERYVIEYYARSVKK